MSGSPGDAGIMMSAAMVRALRGGVKTQTRRLASKQGKPSRWHRLNLGDLIWVRETWAVASAMDGLAPSHIPTGCPIRFLADNNIPLLSGSGAPCWGRSRAALHMPRFLSRTTLEVLWLKLERLQDITEGGAMAEGMWEDSLIQAGGPMAAAQWVSRAGYARLWDMLHGTGSWSANPEVLVIGFKVHRANIDAVGRKQAEWQYG